MSGATGETMRHTPLYELHRELGGRLVPFAGYAMPVQYPTGIIAEHMAVRTGVGLIDLSPFGKIRVEGRDAEAVLAALPAGDAAG